MKRHSLYMRGRLALLAFALASVVTVPKAAPTAGSHESDPSQTIVTNLASRFPDIKVTAVVPVVQWPGIYEVVVEGGQILYSDRNGDYLITGRIVDARTKADLTTDRWTELHRIDFSTLPLHLAIKTVRGDGSRRVAIFEDPDCPYCRQLEQELAGLSDVTIYTFLYPLERLHPGSREKSIRIWCAPDRAEAWSSWMLRSVLPATPACDGAELGKIEKLGAELAIDSTPTIYLADGRRLSGAMSRADFERNLGSVSPAH